MSNARPIRSGEEIHEQLFSREFDRTLAVANAINRCFDLVVTGEDQIPQDGPNIVVANHGSLLDSPQGGAILANRGLRFVYVGKKELDDGKGGDYMWRRGTIYVDRGNPTRQTLVECHSALDFGVSLGIYIEGTRKNGTRTELGEPELGAADLALEHDAAVLIVGMARRMRIIGKPVAAVCIDYLSKEEISAIVESNKKENIVRRRDGIPAVRSKAALTNVIGQRLQAQMDLGNMIIGRPIPSLK